MAETANQAMLAALYGALTDEWQTTQQVALAVGLRWTPGSADLANVRGQLFALAEYREDVEHEPRKNGHKWRRVADSQEPSDG